MNPLAQLEKTLAEFWRTNDKVRAKLELIQGEIEKLQTEVKAEYWKIREAKAGAR